MLFNHNFLVISSLFFFGGGGGCGKVGYRLVIGSVRPSVSLALSFFDTILFDKNTRIVIF